MELIEDLFNHHVSQGSIVSFNETIYTNLEDVEKNIKNELTSSSKVVHFDETGIYIDKKTQWLHVASNEKLTYYEVHEKRGKKAVNAIGILPSFIGTAVLDCYKTYFTYTNCKHGICNAHILRELNAVTELHNQNCGQPMKELKRL